MKVNSNKGALTHILMNLISNATESISGEGDIRISADQTGKSLSIKDTGCGISQRNQERIFDLAFTTKKEKGGTGLGLYIVKELSDDWGSE